MCGLLLWLAALRPNENNNMTLSLTTLLSYENEAVIDRYERDFPQNHLSGKKALQEFLKYVWICFQHADDLKTHPHEEALQFKCVMHQEMKEIDQFWHTFLLFTRDYQSFCTDFLAGRFFHHEPINWKETVIDESVYELELTRYLNYLYDQLGAETVSVWFRMV